MYWLCLDLESHLQATQFLAASKAGCWLCLKAHSQTQTRGEVYGGVDVAFFSRRIAARLCHTEAVQEQMKAIPSASVVSRNRRAGLQAFDTSAGLWWLRYHAGIRRVVA